MPFVQVVDVGENFKLEDQTKQKISKQAQPFSVFVPSGKIIITLQGSIGRIAITQYPCYVDRTILIIEESNIEDSELFFIYAFFIVFNYEKTRAPGGTIKTITKEAFGLFKVHYPTLNERLKIGLYFKNFDSLITLHQRKYEKLQNIKKSLLKHIFQDKNEFKSKRK